jgi:CRISPR/Cas system endoribonuclease Cas6 (RAMP superfamily)
VIKYSLAALGHFLSSDHIEKSMREKETTKAFFWCKHRCHSPPVRRMYVGIPASIRDNHFSSV